MKRSEADFIEGYDSNQRRYRIDKNRVLHCWGGPETPFGYQLGISGPRTWGTRRYQLTHEQVENFNQAEDKMLWIWDQEKLHRMKGAF